LLYTLDYIIIIDIAAEIGEGIGVPIIMFYTTRNITLQSWDFHATRTFDVVRSKSAQ